MRCIEKTLYTNGRIVTMDAAGTVAEAVLVAGNVIEAVGSKDGLAALAGPGCRTVDLKGASLYPGFIDTHSHASLYAMWKTHCRCPGIAHLEDVYPLIRRQAERVRGDDGIVVYNFDDTDIPERRGPTKRELDAVMPDRPVLVFHISGHTCYANSKALERIGVNPDAPFDDVNVFLGKDGLPNGYIAEEMAFKAMGELMPALDQERHKALVRECVAEYNAQGFTSAHDSAVGIGNLSAETVYRTYNQLYESGELNMRVYLATMEQPFRRLEPTGLLDGPGNRFVQYSAVKTLADGSIQAGTAAIPEGYFFDPSLRPGIIGTQDYWDEMVYHWHSRGRQLSIHCNGVGAIETIITAVERAQARCPRKDARHLIIHCQMATDEHVRRMKEAGILPSFYGLHVWNWGDRHRDIFLGPDRAARLDPAGSAVRADHALHPYRREPRDQGRRGARPGTAHLHAGGRARLHFLRGAVQPQRGVAGHHRARQGRGLRDPLGRHSGSPGRAAQGHHLRRGHRGQQGRARAASLKRKTEEIGKGGNPS